MTFEENHPLVRQMLAELYRHTDGDPARHASMYDLGAAAAGLDRQAAQEVGQALIGAGLASIVSLSGSISITVEGIARVEADGAPPRTVAAVRLGDGPVLDAEAVEAVETAVARLKSAAGDRGWSFDLLCEVMADLKTIDAQLQSPRPKAAIVRAGLHDIAAVLQGVGDRDLLSPIEALIG